MPSLENHSFAKTKRFFSVIHLLLFASFHSLVSPTVAVSKTHEVSFFSLTSKENTSFKQRWPQKFLVDMRSTNKRYAGTKRMRLFNRRPEIGFTEQDERDEELISSLTRRISSIILPFTLSSSLVTRWRWERKTQLLWKTFSLTTFFLFKANGTRETPASTSHRRYCSQGARQSSFEMNCESVFYRHWWNVAAGDVR